MFFYLYFIFRELISKVLEFFIMYFLFFLISRLFFNYVIFGRGLSVVLYEILVVDFTVLVIRRVFFLILGGIVVEKYIK